jgi:chromosome segregation ATPase
VDRKEQNCSKLQTDLDDILANYQKTQAKHLQLEKRAKDNEKEVRTLREEKAELLNRINLLEVRLTNHKEKYDELAHRESAKIKTVEVSHEKKVKILRDELEQARLGEEEARKEMEEMGSEHRARIEQLEIVYREKIEELIDEVGRKEEEASRKEE